MRLARSVLLTGAVVAAVALVEGRADAQVAHGRTSPDAVLAGETITVLADFTEYGTPPAAATADATALGGPAAVPLAATATPGVLSAAFTTGAAVAVGDHDVVIAYTDPDTSAAASVSATVAVIDKARCLPPGWGVPSLAGESLHGPPRWTSWAGDTRFVLDGTDDPRWNGATAGGGGFANGSATDPVNFRSVYSGGYLYLQWIVKVSSVDGARVLDAGFRSHGRSYIVRFHLDGAETGFTDVKACAGSFNTCDDPVGPLKGTYFKVFEETETALPCGGSDRTVFTEYTAGGAVGLAWLDESARYYPLGANDWALQIRVPVAATHTAFTAGIDDQTAMWFESDVDLAGNPGVFTWPKALRDSGTSVCQGSLTSTNPRLYHTELGTSQRLEPVRLLYQNIDLPQCKLGVRLRVDQVGAVREPLPPGETLATVTPTSKFVARDVAGVPTDNILIARPENPTGDVIPQAALTASFRIADWGVQMSAQDQWNPIPGGTDVALSADVPASGGRGLFSFTWPLGDSEAHIYDPTVDRDHQCVLVEMKTTGAGGASVEIENDSVYRNMDFGTMSTFGQQAIVDVRGLPVAPGQTFHEVYLVAVPRNLPQSLPATDGIDLLRRSAERVARQARAPYAKVLEQQGGDAGGEPGRRPDGADNQLLDQWWRTPLAEPRRELDGGERFRKIAREYERPEDDLMIGPDRALVDVLLGVAHAQPDGESPTPAQDLTTALAGMLDAVTLAEILPTLEVYAFYKSDVGASEDGAALMRPMTSFTFFLSHDGAPVTGMRWVIDGAEQVEPGGNVYRLKIPVDKDLRRIQVRVQAVEAGEQLVSGNVKWPCGCCSNGSCPAAFQAGNAGLAALALWFAGLRRRKPRKRG